MRMVRIYSYQEQVEDLSKATGLSIQAVKRVLKMQRQLVQDKLRLGYSYTLKGVVKIEPKQKGEDIILTSTVAQSVVRPAVIKTIGVESELEALKIRTIEDEELD